MSKMSKIGYAMHCILHLELNTC